MSIRIRIRIRISTADDLESINTIITAAVMTWDLPERVKRLTLPSYHYTVQDLQHMHIVLAERGATPLAVAAWETQQTAIDDDMLEVLLLHGIYVDPQQQRQGIGKALFDAALRAARDEDLDGVLVKAQKGSEVFYSAMGMRPLAVADTQRDFENRYYLSL